MPKNLTAALSTSEWAASLMGIPTPTPTLARVFHAGNNKRYMLEYMERHKETWIMDDQDVVQLVIRDTGSVHEAEGKLGDLTLVGDKWHFFRNPNRDDLYTFQQDRNTAIIVMARTLLPKRLRT